NASGRVHDGSAAAAAAGAAAGFVREVGGVEAGGTQRVQYLAALQDALDADASVLGLEVQADERVCGLQRVAHAGPVNGGGCAGDLEVHVRTLVTGARML